jgi:hypothetical protein
MRTHATLWCALAGACSSPAPGPTADPAVAAPASDASSPDAGARDGDASPRSDAGDSGSDAGATDARDDAADLVAYGGQHTLQTTWGCAVAWTPTNVPGSVTVGGVDYALTVIGGICVDPNPLVPMKASSGFHVTTNIGAWAVRFETPGVPGEAQLLFYAYGGDTSAQTGARFSIARWPGEYHDDGRGPSLDYCDFGNSDEVVMRVVDQLDPSSRVCQLRKNTFYYFNATVPAIDPRGNSSVFGWASGF